MQLGTAFTDGPPKPGPVLVPGGGLVHPPTPEYQRDVEARAARKAELEAAAQESGPYDDPLGIGRAFTAAYDLPWQLAGIQPPARPDPRVFNPEQRKLVEQAQAEGTWSPRVGMPAYPGGPLVAKEGAHRRMKLDPVTYDIGPAGPPPRLVGAGDPEFEATRREKEAALARARAVAVYGEDVVGQEEGAGRGAPRARGTPAPVFVERPFGTSGDVGKEGQDLAEAITLNMNPGAAMVMGLASLFGYDFDPQRRSAIPSLNLGRTVGEMGAWATNVPARVQELVRGDWSMTGLTQALGLQGLGERGGWDTLLTDPAGFAADVAAGFAPAKIWEQTKELVAGLPMLVGEVAGTLSSPMAQHEKVQHLGGLTLGVLGGIARPVVGTFVGPRDVAREGAVYWAAGWFGLADLGAAAIPAMARWKPMRGMLMSLEAEARGKVLRAAGRAQEAEAAFAYGEGTFSQSLAQAMEGGWLLWVNWSGRRVADAAAMVLQGEALKGPLFTAARWATNPLIEVGRLVWRRYIHAPGRGLARFMTMSRSARLPEAVQSMMQEARGVHLGAMLDYAADVAAVPAERLPTVVAVLQHWPEHTVSLAEIQAVGRRPIAALPEVATTPRQPPFVAEQGRPLQTRPAAEAVPRASGEAPPILEPVTTDPATGRVLAPRQYPGTDALMRGEAMDVLITGGELTGEALEAQLQAARGRLGPEGAAQLDDAVRRFTAAGYNPGDIARAVRRELGVDLAGPVTGGMVVRHAKPGAGAPAAPPPTAWAEEVLGKRTTPEGLSTTGELPLYRGEIGASEARLAAAEGAAAEATLPRGPEPPSVAHAQEIADLRGREDAAWTDAMRAEDAAGRIAQAVAVLAMDLHERRTGAPVPRTPAALAELADQAVAALEGSESVGDMVGPLRAALLRAGEQGSLPPGVPSWKGYSAVFQDIRRGQRAAEARAMDAYNARQRLEAQPRLRSGAVPERAATEGGRPAGQPGRADRSPEARAQRTIERAAARASRLIARVHTIEARRAQQARSHVTYVRYASRAIRDMREAAATARRRVTEAEIQALREWETSDQERARRVNALRADEDAALRDMIRADELSAELETRAREATQATGNPTAGAVLLREAEAARDLRAVAEAQADAAGRAIAALEGTASLPEYAAEVRRAVRTARQYAQDARRAAGQAHRGEQALATAWERERMAAASAGVRTANSRMDAYQASSVLADLMHGLREREAARQLPLREGQAQHQVELDRRLAVGPQTAAAVQPRLRPGEAPIGEGAAAANAAYERLVERAQAEPVPRTRARNPDQAAQFQRLDGIRWNPEATWRHPESGAELPGAFEIDPDIALVFERQPKTLERLAASADTMNRYGRPIHQRHLELRAYAERQRQRAIALDPELPGRMAEADRLAAEAEAADAQAARFRAHAERTTGEQRDTARRLAKERRAEAGVARQKAAKLREEAQAAGFFTDDESLLAMWSPEVYEAFNWLRRFWHERVAGHPDNRAAYREAQAYIRDVQARMASGRARGSATPRVSVNTLRRAGVPINERVFFGLSRDPWYTLKRGYAQLRDAMARFDMYLSYVEQFGDDVLVRRPTRPRGDVTTPETLEANLTGIREQLPADRHAAFDEAVRRARGQPRAARTTTAVETRTAHPEPAAILEAIEREFGRARGNVYVTARGRVVGETVPEGYRQVPDDPMYFDDDGTPSANKRFGPVAGKWIPKDIWYEFVYQDQFAQVAGAILPALMRIWKATKTTLHPGTLFRNIYSTLLLFAPASGVSPFDPRNARYWARALEDFLRRDKTADWRVAYEQGLFHTDLASNEVLQHQTSALFGGLQGHAAETGAFAWQLLSLPWKLGSWRDGGAAAVGRFVTDAVPTAARRFFWEYPGLLYGAVDDLAKYVAFLKRMDESRAGGFGDTQAGTIVRGVLQDILDYSDMPGFAQWLRAPLARTAGESIAWAFLGRPFISYSVKAIPRFLRFLEEHPFKAMALSRVYDYLSELSRAEAGMTKKEEDAYMASRPGYEQAGHLPVKRERLPGGDKRVTTENIAYLTVGSEFLAQEEPLAAESSFGPWLASLTTGNPFLQIPLSLVTGRGFRGMPIYRPGAPGTETSWLEPVSQGLSYAWEQIAPPLLPGSAMRAKAEAAEKGWPDRYGRIRPPAMVGLERWGRKQGVATTTDALVDQVRRLHGLLSKYRDAAQAGALEYGRTTLGLALPRLPSAKAAQTGGFTTPSRTDPTDRVTPAQRVLQERDALQAQYWKRAMERFAESTAGLTADYESIPGLEGARNAVLELASQPADEPDYLVRANQALRRLAVVLGVENDEIVRRSLEEEGWTRPE